MSTEADFGRTGWVFQADGSQFSWMITWPGVLDDARYTGVSFQGDFVNSQLTRVSETFGSDQNENPFVTEVVRATGDSAFRFSVVVMPNH